MGVRAECTHIATESNQTIKVELIGASYGGASRELIGTGANWCVLSYDQLDYTDLFNTVVQRGRLDFSYYVQDATDESILDEIIAAGQGEYTLKLYINGSQYWVGEVMLDQLGAQEEGRPYPYAVRLTAKDFTTLDRELFPLEDNRQTIAKIAGRILSQTGYGLPIWTHTSWTEANTTASNDFMRQIYADTRNLHEYTRNGFVQFTYLEALTRVLAPFRCIVRQELGVFTITQWSEYETPSAVLRTVYDSDGDYVSQSEVNTTVSANSTVTVVQGSTSEFKPGYKRVSATYAHRTSTSGIQVPEVVTLDSVTTSASYDQVIEITGTDINQRIEVNATALVNLTEANTGISIGSEPKIGIQLKLTLDSVVYYWNRSALTWQTTAYTNEFTTRGDEQAQNVSDFPTGILFTSFVAPISFTTTPLAFLNSGEGGFATIELILNKAVTIPASRTTFQGASVEITSESNTTASEALSYTLTQPGNFSTNYNGGTYYFGSGPLTSSPGSLRYGTGDLEVVGLWGRRGGANEYEFHVQNLKEVMDLYRGWNKVMTAVIKQVGYDTTKTLAYNSGFYNAIGGTFDGYRGWWTALVFDNNLVVSALDNIDLGIIGGDRQLITGAYTAARLNSQNALERSGGYAFRLAVDATGTVTQLFVQNTLTEYPRLLANAEIRVVHPITLDDYVFIVSEDMTEGSLVIPVVSQIISETIPAGSFVYTNPGDASTAILIGREAIRAVARSRAVGVLRNAVDGVVTSLDVVMYEPVRDGQDFVVFNPDTLVEYNITVDGSFNVTDTTITIQEQLVIAPVGAYVTGSESYKQAELIVTPSQVINRVVRTENAVSLGDLRSEVAAGPGVVVLPLENTAVGTVVLDGMTVVAKAFNGTVEEFVVDGEQTINADPFDLDVVSATSSGLDVGTSIEQPSFALTGEISTLAGTVILKAVANGGGTEIESLALVRLDATPVGSSILLQADNITVVGQTTFLNSLAENGFTSIADNNVVIYADTPPATRDGGGALVAGDVWRETDENDRPYVWTGSAWLRGFTVIDGGTITTGTINANLVDITADSGTVTITGDGLRVNPSGGSEDVLIDSNGINIAGGSDATDIPKMLTLGNSQDGQLYYGTNIYTSTGTGLYLTSVSGTTIYVAPGAGSTDSQGDFIVQLTEGALVESFMYVKGGAMIVEWNATSNSTSTGALRVPNGGIGVGGDSYFADSVRVVDTLTTNGLVVGTQANKATISYTTNEAWTFTIPDVGGNRTFAFINEAQTFSANQTFEYERLLLRNSDNAGSATLRYGTTGASNRTYTFSGNSGTVLTEGNYTGTLDSVYLRQDNWTLSSAETLNEWIEVTVGLESYVWQVHRR